MSQAFPLRAGQETAARMDYEEAKRQARDSDPEVRLALARRADVQPEILYYLAADKAEGVRREIAGNTTTPAQADLLLAGDADDDIRRTIAHKVAQFAPGLSAVELDRFGSVVADTLRVLASDKLVEVRRILAEELKSAGNIDAGVIERLARDQDDMVALPVLEHSPLLSDELLIEVIHSGPVQSRLAAIAGRAGLGAAVSDAIVETEDDAAITALLTNQSAQIREETLDALIDEGMGKPDWHQPLVNRPQLSSGAVVKLSGYVAQTLLAKLIERRDIDPATADVLSEKLKERLDDNGADGGKELPEERAAKLNRQNRLDEHVVFQAAGSGDREFVIAALGEKSGLGAAVVRKVAMLDDPVGLLAVVRKAGFSMQLAELAQERLLRIAPNDIRRAEADGGYPLTDHELEWRLELFQDA